MLSFVIISGHNIITVVCSYGVCFPLSFTVVGVYGVFLDNFTVVFSCGVCFLLSFSCSLQLWCMLSSNY